NIFGVVADQAVALAGHPVLDLAGRRELEAFFDAALGLQLGHFVSFIASLDATLCNRHGSPFGRAIDFPTIWKAGAYRGETCQTQPTKAVRSHCAEGTCPCPQSRGDRSTSACRLRCVRS